MFRGTSEARAKGAAGSSAEVAVGSPAEVAGGKAKTCPLSSEESDGALSRSEAPHVFLRPASSPARHSFHGLKSVTG